MKIRAAIAAAATLAAVAGFLLGLSASPIRATVVERGYHGVIINALPVGSEKGETWL